MPMPFYMSIQGEKQGLISQGAGEQSSHEDEVLCQAFEHVVSVPMDSKSGTATGKRVHNAMVITKTADRTTPMLYNAMVIGERLTKVTIRHYRIESTGVQMNHFTVELENAVISSIKASAPNYLDPTKEQFTYIEEVSFAYQSITWTWEDGGVMSMDTWMVE